MPSETIIKYIGHRPVYRVEAHRLFQTINSVPPLGREGFFLPSPAGENGAGAGGTRLGSPTEPLFPLSKRLRS